MADPIVHVVDDDAPMRDSLTFLLESADFKVRSYASAPDLLARGAALEPGIIITDVRMPEVSGLELIERLKALHITHPVIVLTGHADVALAVQAMKAGVVEFLEKPFQDEALLNAVRAALVAGGSAASREAEKAELRARLGQLTGRERDVFDAIVVGESNKEAALRLGISPRTVEIYRANVMAKMQAQSLSELVRMALRCEG